MQLPRRVASFICVLTLFSQVPQTAFPSPLQVQTGSLSQGRDDKVIGVAAQLHDGSGVVQVDPRLQEFVDQFKSRFSHLHNVVERITEKFGSLEQFASGYKVFGFQRVEPGQGSVVHYSMY